MEPFADSQLRQQLAAVVEQQGEQIAKMVDLFEKVDRVFDAISAELAGIVSRVDAIAAQVGVPPEATR